MFVAMFMASSRVGWISRSLAYDVFGPLFDQFELVDMYRLLNRFRRSSPPVGASIHFAGVNEGVIQHRGRSTDPLFLERREAAPAGIRLSATVEASVLSLLSD